jgi:hypothetical protein
MLEFWHDETNEVFVSSRSGCCGNNKAIARALYQPLFELVRNLLRPADDRVMNPAAAACTLTSGLCVTLVSREVAAFA